jgi:cell division protein FtsN
MAHDYAYRPHRTRVKEAPVARFHTSSFASGIVLGVALTLAALTAPRWLSSDAEKPAAEPEASVPTSSSQQPQFEFYERLPNMQVQADPATYGPPIAPKATVASATTSATRPPTAGRQFVLQAGSFRSRDEAERLRESLERLGFETTTMTVTLGGGTQRHRVLVGPYANEPDAHRAITQLRERDIDALPMVR